MPIVKVKASKRKGKIVKAHTRRTTKTAAVSTNGVAGGLLNMVSDAKAEFGTKGMFPSSKEAAMFQVVVNSKLKENGWKINSWEGNKITATKNSKKKSVDYTKHKDKYNASANTINSMFN